MSEKAKECIFIVHVPIEKKQWMMELLEEFVITIKPRTNSHPEIHEEVQQAVGNGERHQYRRPQVGMRANDVLFKAMKEDEKFTITMNRAKKLFKEHRYDAKTAGTRLMAMEKHGIVGGTADREVWTLTAMGKEIDNIKRFSVSGE